MRIKPTISIALFVLLFFSIQTAPAFDTAVACYYFDKLKAGDEFTWSTNLLIEEEPYPDYLDFLENEYGIANNSIAKLKIYQNLKGINFHWDSFNASEYNDYFSLTISGNELSYESNDELYYWFLMYTRIDYSNGTTQNPTEDSWAFFVIDDFYFNRENSDIEITIEDNVVAYDCFLEYDPYENISFKGLIDKSTGLMLFFQADINYTNSVFTLIFEIQNYTLGSVTWSPSISMFLILIIPLALIKRRK